MKKIYLTTIVQNFKKNLLLLFSTVAGLCLFLSPSFISLLMAVAVFGAVSVFVLLNQAKPPVISTRFMQMAAVLIAILIAFMGYDTFRTTWMSSSTLAFLANVLHLSNTTLLLIIGLLGCIVGFYAMYTLSCWIVTLVHQMLKEKLPEQQKTVLIANLKRNYYFPISAMAFFCLNASLTHGYFAGIPIAFIASIVVASQITSMSVFVKKNNMGLNLISIMTSLGICWGGQVSFYADCNAWFQAQALNVMLPIAIDIPGFASVFGAVAAVFFVYFCVLIFWKKMLRIISENGVLDGVKISELIIYSVIIIASLVFTAISFTQTEAFYGTEYAYDIIYTSDSPSLVKGNVYLALTHPENDLRQPLFAVFSAPFVGIPYLIGKLFSASASIQAILIDSVQVIMLTTANFMLAKMMKLNRVKRICFMLLISSTYTYLLFILMIEQYIIAYFWLIFCLYLIIEKQQPDRIALWGAGGTLLTSLVLLPCMSENSLFRNFREWFSDMVEYGLEFIGVMLVFCRFDVIFNLAAKISFLSGFAGNSLTTMEKIFQYTAFIRNCIVVPDAGVNTNAVDHISWQLNDITNINFMGVAILLLVIVSAVLNRDKKSSLLAAGWVAFSAIMLLGLGWGTEENGLILYALYFGWAFFVLLFQLVEKIENKLNIEFFIPVLSVGCMVVLAVFNIPAIMEMVNFATTYFPA